MTTAPPIPRRRFRFGLRTLLVLTTLVAIGAWIYAVGWPWWVVYHEQARFERIMLQLKAGVTTGDIWSRVGAKNIGAMYTSTPDNKLIGIARFPRPNGVYFVCLEYPQGYSGTMMGAQSTRVEVYRLPPVPSNYRSHISSTVYRGDPALDGYTADFHDFYLKGPPKFQRPRHSADPLRSTSRGDPNKLM